MDLHRFFLVIAISTLQVLEAKVTNKRIVINPTINPERRVFTGIDDDQWQLPIIGRWRRDTSESDSGAILSETKNYLEIGSSVIKLEESRKDLMLIVGMTGAGKTTLAKILSGDLSRLHLAKRPGGGVLYVDDDNEVSKPGQSTVSKTIYPSLVIDPETNSTMYDCPGFKDTRSPSIEIATSFFMKQVTQHARSLKVLLISPRTAVTPGHDRHQFAETVKQVTALLKDTSVFRHSIALIVSKVTMTEDDTEEEILYGVETLIEDLRSSYSAKSTPEDNKRANFMLDALLSKDEEGKHTNIGILINPSRKFIGPVKNIPSLLENRRKLRKIVFHNDNFRFAPVEPSNFGHTLSERGKRVIVEMKAQFSEALETALRNASSELVYRFKDSVFKNTTFDAQQNVTVNILQRLRQSFPVFQHEANSSVKTCVEEITNVCRDLQIQAPKESMDAIDQNAGYLEFAEGASDTTRNSSKVKAVKSKLFRALYDAGNVVAVQVSNQLVNDLSKHCVTYHATKLEKLGSFKEQLSIVVSDLRNLEASIGNLGDNQSLDHVVSVTIDVLNNIGIPEVAQSLDVILQYHRYVSDSESFPDHTPSLIALDSIRNKVLTELTELLHKIYVNGDTIGRKSSGEAITNFIEKFKTFFEPMRTMGQKLEFHQFQAGTIRKLLKFQNLTQQLAENQSLEAVTKSSQFWLHAIGFTNPEEALSILGMYEKLVKSAHLSPSLSIKSDGLSEIRSKLTTAFLELMTFSYNVANRLGISTSSKALESIENGFQATYEVIASSESIEYYHDLNVVIEDLIVVVSSIDKISNMTDFGAIITEANSMFADLGALNETNWILEIQDYVSFIESSKGIAEISDTVMADHLDKVQNELVKKTFPLILKTVYNFGDSLGFNASLAGIQKFSEKFQRYYNLKIQKTKLFQPIQSTVSNDLELLTKALENMRQQSGSLGIAANETIDMCENLGLFITSSYITDLSHYSEYTRRASQVSLLPELKNNVEKIRTDLVQAVWNAKSLIDSYKSLIDMADRVLEKLDTLSLDTEFLETIGRLQLGPESNLNISDLEQVQFPGVGTTLLRSMLSAGEQNKMNLLHHLLLLVDMKPNCSYDSAFQEVILSGSVVTLSSAKECASRYTNNNGTPIRTLSIFAARQVHIDTDMDGAQLAKKDGLNLAIFSPVLYVDNVKRITLDGPAGSPLSAPVAQPGIGGLPGNPGGNGGDFVGVFLETKIQGQLTVSFQGGQGSSGQQGGLGTSGKDGRSVQFENDVPELEFDATALQSPYGNEMESCCVPNECDKCKIYLVHGEPGTRGSPGKDGGKGGAGGKSGTIKLITTTAGLAPTVVTGDGAPGTDGSGGHGGLGGKQGKSIYVKRYSETRPSPGGSSKCFPAGTPFKQLAGLCWPASSTAVYRTERFNKALPESNRSDTGSVGGTGRVQSTSIVPESRNSDAFIRRLKHTYLCFLSTLDFNVVIRHTADQMRSQLNLLL